MAARQQAIQAPSDMDFTRYQLVRAEPDVAWDEFVQASPQGTIFSTSAFVAALRQLAGCWYCLKNDQVRAAVAVMETDRGASTDLHDLVIHNGIMFERPHHQQNSAQAMSEEFRTTSFIVGELARLYRRVRVATHPDFNDIRPFLWYNYGCGGPTFNVDVRYTSILSLDSPNWDGELETSTVYAGATASRRTRIRHGIKNRIETEVRYDPDLFETLYRRTFNRQDLAPENDLSELREVLDSLDQRGRLRCFISRNSDNRPGTIAIFGLDEKRAYYLYGASDPELRDEQTGTMVLWDAFRHLSRDGVREVDLEGVNSPKRGYFKLSFGGAIVPYYHLSL